MDTSKNMASALSILELVSNLYRISAVFYAIFLLLSSHFREVQQETTHWIEMAPSPAFCLVSAPLKAGCLKDCRVLFHCLEHPLTAVCCFAVWSTQGIVGCQLTDSWKSISWICCQLTDSWKSISCLMPADRQLKNYLLFAANWQTAENLLAVCCQMIDSW